MANDLIVTQPFSFAGTDYAIGALVADPATVAAMLADPVAQSHVVQIGVFGSAPPPSSTGTGTATVAGGTGTGAGLTAAQQAALTPAGDVSGATVGTLTVAQLAAEVAQIAGLTLNPSGMGAAPTGATTIAVAGTYQVLFAAGSIANGAYLQNPPSNKVPLYVDTAGATGTILAATSFAVQPGQSWRTVFKPTNAVTVYSTAPISFQAGTY